MRRKKVKEEPAAEPPKETASPKSVRGILAEHAASAKDMAEAVSRLLQDISGMREDVRRFVGEFYG